jgi:AcrR family transcriptional regulator
MGYCESLEREALKVQPMPDVFVRTEPALKKGEMTRKLLLAAARRVFARERYMNAEITHITKEAGKSSGVFYTYFTNKADLLLNLIEDFKQELHGIAIPSPKNAPEDAAHVIIALWNTYKAHAPTFLALTDAATHDASFAAEQQSLRNLARLDFEGMIRARQAQGYCLDLDPRFTAMALETMVNFCLYEWLAQGQGRFDHGAQEQLAFNTLAGIMDAVVNPQRERRRPPEPALADKAAALDEAATQRGSKGLLSERTVKGKAQVD